MLWPCRHLSAFIGGSCRLSVWHIKILLALYPLLATAQVADKEKPATLPTVSVCDLLSHPAQYDGKLVKLRAKTRGTDEGSWFVGEGCEGIFVAQGFVWPSDIAMAAAPGPDAPRSASYLHKVDFDFDNESWQKTMRKVQLLPRIGPSECLIFTYTGMFETRPEWYKDESSRLIGTTTFGGFGHLGGAPAQFIPKSFDDVEVLSNCASTPSPNR